MSLTFLVRIITPIPQGNLLNKLSILKIIAIIRKVILKIKEILVGSKILIAIL